MSLCSAFSPTKETSHCFRRVPTLFLFVWPWKARSVLLLALLRLSAWSCREAAAGQGAFCRGNKGKKDSASEIPLVLLSLPPSQHKSGFVCAQEPTKKFGHETSSPLEKGEGVEHVAYTFRHKLVPTPPSRSWARHGDCISWLLSYFTQLQGSLWDSSSWFESLRK